jgi:protein ImuB
MKDASSNPSRRYLAVWFPFLCADRSRARAGTLSAQDEAPLAFIEKQKGALTIAAFNKSAAALGVEPGLKLADARARLKQLKAEFMDPDADKAWLYRIADACDRYTPMLEAVAPDLVLLDITGCAHLFGGEAELRSDLLKRFSKVASQVRTGIAGTPQAARALVRFGAKEHVIVPVGEDALAVATLPVAALEAGHDISIALSRAGLKTLGDLAERPRAPLAARFGQETVRTLARILGEKDLGITPYRPLPPCSIERRFAEPIADSEAILGVLAHLAGQISAQLERRASGGRRFVARFFRVDGEVAVLQVETAQPLRDAGSIVRLFKERIDTLHTPLDHHFGYDLLRLCVPVIESLADRQRSLDGNEQDEETITDLINRLQTRLGRHAVLQYSPVETHIPEKAEKTAPAGTTSIRAQAWLQPSLDDAPRRPVFLFERPQPIEAVAEIPDGPPLRFRWRRVLHDVVRAEGPERIAPEWWRCDDRVPTRDYYRIEDTQGERYWVFRNGLFGEERDAPRWFVHGLFA